MHCWIGHIIIIIIITTTTTIIIIIVIIISRLSPDRVKRIYLFVVLCENNTDRELVKPWLLLLLLLLLLIIIISNIDNR